MKIKGYLFTGVAKQLNHTYYSIGEHLYARFYQTLLFLRKGYKIRDFDYDNYGNNDRGFATIQRTQKIFKNEDYKYI